jgi:hypothetical protein
MIEEDTTAQQTVGELIVLMGYYGRLLAEKETKIELEETIVDDMTEIIDRLLQLSNRANNLLRRRRA